jgi:hypothetical protein
VRIGRYVDFADALHLTGSAGTACRVNLEVNLGARYVARLHEG